MSPTPNLEDQVPVFMSPSDRVTQLYPQAPDSLSVAFYDSQVEVQGDSKLLPGFPWPINGNPDSNLESLCILIRLHTGKYSLYQQIFQAEDLILKEAMFYILYLFLMPFN
jgi:hypothetical protein